MRGGAGGAGGAGPEGAEGGSTLPEAEDAPYALKALWAVPGKGRAWLDFANDVTVKDVKLAAQEGFRRSST
jgi:hypothetical protein